MTRHFSIRTSFYTICILVAGASGCATLTSDTTSMKGLVESAGDLNAESVAQQDAREFTIELRSPEQKPKRKNCPYREGMLVQHALSISGANEQFDRMQVYVARRNQNGEGVHVIRSAYDPKSRKIPEPSNYAIYPGDRVVFKEEPYSAIDAMLDQVLGPLNKVLGL